MRKKSHLALAGYLLNGMENETLRRRWKAFYFGSVLPDLKPSFVTKRHEYEATFDLVAGKLRALSCAEGDCPVDSMRYIMDLGQVLHYIADYFTFPHNPNYPGNLKAHCIYEKRLKKRLRVCVREDRVLFPIQYRMPCSADEILEEIRKLHQAYMEEPSDVERDCDYITTACARVLFSLLQFQPAPAAKLACAG
ncbi:MAG: zinc dependent phospholipase C family protein [Lachnospiraceae bacterium]|nr:zinc dependent phospholipase C family protein [Lachnospiraceae bacterium]